MTGTILRDWTELLPPPELVRHRAWECAFVLTEEHRHRLAWAEDRYCSVVLRASPDGIGWQETGEMLALFRRLVGARR